MKLARALISAKRIRSAAMHSYILSLFVWDVVGGFQNSGEPKRHHHSQEIGCCVMHLHFASYQWLLKI